MLLMSGVAQAPAEPAFRDRSGHAAHWIRPRRYHGHDKLCACGMLCVDARSVFARTIASVAANPAIPVGTKWRRCAHRGGPDVPDTLLPHVGRRKPVGDICKERVPAADGSAHRRSASTGAFLFLEQTAADPDAKSGQSGAPDRSGTAACAAGTAACAAGAAAS